MTAVAPLTLLAPDIVEAIMDGRQPAELGVRVLREGLPAKWGEQRMALAVLQDALRLGVRGSG